jgi:hypothetical protein
MVKRKNNRAAEALEAMIVQHEYMDASVDAKVAVDAILVDATEGRVVEFSMAKCR